MDMELILIRKYKQSDYTIGHLYCGGQWLCDVLERKDRGLSSAMPEKEIRTRKVKGQTAIPTRRYRITLKMRSPKFASDSRYAWCGGRLPRLKDVPGFEGVLMHAGNTAKDSRGCLLIGVNTRRGRLASSMKTLKRLYARMMNDPEEIWLTIESRS